MHRFRALALLAAAVITGCDAPTAPSGVLGDANDPSLHRHGFGAKTVSVLNWNIYIGTNVDEVLEALQTTDPNDDGPALQAAIATLQATAFPARAQAIAEHIARFRPHVVGLQEVTTIEIPPNIDLNFLAILQAALSDRGLSYAVPLDPIPAIVTNTNVTLPLPGGGSVRVVDHDALLVDTDRVTSSTTLVAQNYLSNVPLPPGSPVSLIRGFVVINAMIGTREYTIGNTHLEPDLGDVDLEGLRALQAKEFVKAIGEASPAIIMGDFNDTPGSAMYDVLIDAGFTDVWAAMRRRAPGFTCCHLPDLSNRRPTFDERIDYVFARGVARKTLGRIDRLGEVPADRFPGPAHRLWPSDHAGLAVKFLLPPGLLAARR